MIIDADILDDAQQIARLGVSSEARRRALISRYYYAAYHRCLSIAVRHGFRYRPGDGAGVHQALIHSMRTSGNTDLSLVSRILAGLRQRRIRADYHIGSLVPVEEMREAAEEADHLLNELLAT